MALSNLDPVTREETILNGDEITPANRGEYFLKKAVNKVPTPDGAADAGKVPKVNSAGDGFTLEMPAGGLFVTLDYVDGAFVIDSTYSAILSAIEAGENVRIAATPDTNTLYLQPAINVPDGPLVFTSIEPLIAGDPAALTGFSVVYVEILSDNSVTVTTSERYFT